MTLLMKVLIEKFTMSEFEADASIKEARKDFNECLKQGDIVEAKNVLADHFGLTNDYIFDLISH